MATKLLAYDAGGLKFPPTPLSGETKVPFGSEMTLESILAAIVAAAGNDKVRLLRIIGHGAEGMLSMGKGFVTLAEVEKFRTLRSVMDDQSTIELHCCEVGLNAGVSGSKGAMFLRKLSDATQATVIAADKAQVYTNADPSDVVMEGTTYAYLPTK